MHLYRHFVSAWRNQLTIERTKLKSIAVINPSTINPGTIFETRIIRNPLMINVNKPKVNILNGNVKIIRIGFINVFTIPSTTETIMAVKKESICTPFNKYPVTKTAKPLMRRLIINCILYC